MRHLYFWTLSRVVGGLVWHRGPSVGRYLRARTSSLRAALPAVELRANVSDITVGVAKDAAEREPRGIVELLRGSAPYIELHQKSIVVVHCSSELLGSDLQWLMDDVATLHVLGVRVVLVASIRQQVDARCGLGRKVRGLRVTGPEELLAVQAEAGVARSRIEACLARGLASSSGTSYGRTRVGVDVVSGNNFYTARPAGVIDGVDMMATGFVRKVEVDKIRRHLDGGEIVLLTALGYAASGETFNVMSEEVAAMAAPALKASKLVFVQSRDLVFKSQDNRRVPSLLLDDARRLVDCLEDPTVSNLVELCVQALAAGVTRAHFVPPTRGALLRELYTRDGAGTLVAADIYEGIRPATSADLPRVVELIEPLEADGTLVQRPRDDLGLDLAAGCYYVLARDDRVIACAMLKRFQSDPLAAEVGCLVVDRAYRKQNKADALLSYLERVAIANRVTSLFALSTQTMHWFTVRGFDEVAFDSLPQDRQSVYDQTRKPKIYRKRLKSDRHVDGEDAFWTRDSTIAAATLAASRS